MAKFSCIVVLIICVSFLLYKDLGSKKNHLEQNAQQIMARCDNQKYPEVCFDKEIPKLMDSPSNLSMEEAFEVTKLVQQKHKNYLYCHVLGHDLAEKEVKKDPSKWTQVISRCPTTMCNNGCPHGTVMGRFKSETLTPKQTDAIMPELKTACEPRNDWHPLDVERAMCYHGLGHLAMYISDGDLRESSSVCQKLTTAPQLVLTCTQGVFMSLFQPLSAEDIALVKDKTPKKEDVRSFCNQFTGDSWSACNRESWPLFYNEILKPDTATEFCSYSNSSSEQTRCFRHILHIVSVEFAVNQNNLKALSDYCHALPSPNDGECFGAAAGRLLQIDPKFGKKSVQICQQPGDKQLQNVCFDQLILFSTTSFRPRSKESVFFCSLFPNEWKKACQEAQSGKEKSKGDVFFPTLDQLQLEK